MTIWLQVVLVVVAKEKMASPILIILSIILATGFPEEPHLSSVENTALSVYRAGLYGIAAMMDF
jgi:hypothetical protein